MRNIYLIPRYVKDKKTIKQLIELLTVGKQSRIINTGSIGKSIDESTIIGQIKQSDCAAIIIGNNTDQQVRVDFEIYQTLLHKKGLVAFSPSNYDLPNISIPPRLADNLESGSGYAKWHKFPNSKTLAMWLIDIACNAAHRKIKNTRQLLK